MLKWLYGKFTRWLSAPRPLEGLPMCDFERLRYEVRASDVLLIEGRSRVSDVIRALTQSPWSHAALYIGRLHDIEDANMRARVLEHYPHAGDQQLVIESLLGLGTIVSPLSKYADYHIRICRPKGIMAQDAQRVINYAASRLGSQYDVRHILDLARFLYPWSIIPRKWRSSLFKSIPDRTTHEICSLMISEAFAKVMFPILPKVEVKQTGKFELKHRNPRLYTPSDFDYSPYFEIIKYPIFELSGAPSYRNLPWNDEALAKAGQPQRAVPQEIGPQSSTSLPSEAPSVSPARSSETVEIEQHEGAKTPVEETTEASPHHPSWSAQIQRKS